MSTSQASVQYSSNKKLSLNMQEQVYTDAWFFPKENYYSLVREVPALKIFVFNNWLVKSAHPSITSFDDSDVNVQISRSKRLF